MKIKNFIIFILSIFIFTNIVNASTIPARKIKIAATTTNISTIIDEICKDKVKLTTIIPATVCPGTYDIDTETVKNLSKINIIMYHPWQDWIKNLKLKITNFSIVYRPLETEGNLMIPYLNLRAAKEITELFSIWDMDNKEFYEKNFMDYSFKISFIAEEISKNNNKFYSKKIVCNSKIATFMEWLGFDVVMTYGKSTDITAKDLKVLIKKIKGQKVLYIVDDLQAGTDVGRKLADDLKLTHIVISNFVLGNSYINTLKNNIEKINKAVK